MAKRTAQAERLQVGGSRRRRQPRADKPGGASRGSAPSPRAITAGDPRTDGMDGPRQRLSAGDLHSHSPQHCPPAGRVQRCGLRRRGEAERGRLAIDLDPTHARLEQGGHRLIDNPGLGPRRRLTSQPETSCHGPGGQTHREGLLTRAGQGTWLGRHQTLQAARQLLQTKALKQQHKNLLPQHQLDAERPLATEATDFGTKAEQHRLGAVVEAATTLQGAVWRGIAGDGTLSCCHGSIPSEPGPKRRRKRA